MKPTKNRTFCASINRVKMLFETKEKADNFINFNAVEIAENNSYAPIRSYYVRHVAVGMSPTNP